MCTCVVSFWEEQSLHREVWCVCVGGGVVTSGMWCVQVWKAGTQECGMMVIN